MWNLDHDFDILEKLLIDMSSIYVRFSMLLKAKINELGMNLWSQNFEYLSILNLSSNNYKLCQICLTKFNQLSAYNKKV